MDRLKYISTERMYEGVIVELTDGGVTIDLKGRLGQFKIPKRMLISDYELELGQEVGFVMSYPEVLAKEPNQKYLDVIERNNKNNNK
ncbi:CBO2463/CBO2479 domain-containing protein [Romboutsia sp.]|uniref:CBO2463/CBO2479 domain-containing protein n=1 Tax=Romboutsia sp. TaxID=1965302 RepID=UPI003F3D39A6